MVLIVCDAINTTFYNISTEDAKTDFIKPLFMMTPNMAIEKIYEGTISDIGHKAEQNSDSWKKGEKKSYNYLWIGLDNSQAGIKIAGRNTNNLR